MLANEHRPNNHTAAFDTGEVDAEGKDLLRCVSQNNAYYDNNLLKRGDGNIKGGVAVTHRRKVDQSFRPVAGLDNGWVCDYGDYVCTIPTSFGRDTDWMEWFTTKAPDDKVRVRPDCDAVEGVLVTDGIFGYHQVEYLNAFGIGVDLLMVPSRTRMQKLLRFTDTSKGDAAYRFEIDGSFEDYVRPFLVWDDLDTVEIECPLTTENGKRYLNKEMPDISTMVSPVYSDATFGPQDLDTDDAWLTVTAKSASVGLGVGGTNFTAVRDYAAAGGVAVANHAERNRTQAYMRDEVPTNFYGYQFVRAQMYFPIGVSVGVVSSGSITMNVSHTGTTRGEGVTANDDGILVTGSPVDPDSIATTDYDIATRFGTTALTTTNLDSGTSGSQVLTLSAAGKSAIPGVSKFKIGVLAVRDLDDVYATAHGVGAWFDWYNGEHATLNPTLDFIYTAAAPTRRTVVGGSRGHGVSNVLPNALRNAGKRILGMVPVE